MDDRKEVILEQGSELASSPSVGSTRELVARYTHCAICGSNLHFTYVTDYSRNLTQENVKCPECDIKVRQVSHRLQ